MFRTRSLTCIYRLSSKGICQVFVFVRASADVALWFAQVARVVDMLAKHETAGQIGGVQAAELRSALIDTQETLRAEIYESSEMAVAPTNPTMKDGDATQEKVGCSRVYILLVEQAFVFFL